MCKKAYSIKSIHHAHHKSCWKNVHHVSDYETTLGNTVVENIVIRNGKKYNHNKVSYNYLGSTTQADHFKKNKIFALILYFV